MTQGAINADRGISSFLFYLQFKGYVQKYITRL